MRKNIEFVFMSMGFFEYFNEIELYVFFFVIYFVCDK